MRSGGAVRMRRGYIGVDVGTGSVRAGLYLLQPQEDGATDEAQHFQCIARASKDIAIHRPQPLYAEQSSEEIWNAVCDVVQRVTADSGADVTVHGIGFDATCSLVVLGEDGKALPLNTRMCEDESVEHLQESDNQLWNVVMWMDHRAMREAEEINGTDHPVLEYVGGKVSPEMAMPKVKWLQRNAPEVWKSMHHIMELPDFLTYRATGDLARSLCSVVCKWNYLPSERSIAGGSTVFGVEGWSSEYLRMIGLEELANDDFKRVGSKVMGCGAAVGAGLSREAAQELGLRPGIAVSASLIDAHAGGVGVIGCSFAQCDSIPLTSRMALIAGTSNCMMTVSEQPCFVPGVWGPYYSAMIPQLWLNEAGQSAAGALIDHLIQQHPSFPSVAGAAAESGESIYVRLNELVASIGREHDDDLTESLHVLPYFLGNRSPLADPSLTGMIAGLTLDSSATSLARLYLATVQAIAYGTAHIIETLNSKGYDITTVIVCGGLAKNVLFVRELADCSGMRVAVPHDLDSVMRGSAVIATVADGVFDSISVASQRLAGKADVIEPRPDRFQFHERKRTVYRRMYEHQLEYRSIMQK